MQSSYTTNNSLQSFILTYFQVRGKIWYDEISDIYHVGQV